MKIKKYVFLVSYILYLIFCLFFVLYSENIESINSVISSVSIASAMFALSELFNTSAKYFKQKYDKNCNMRHVLKFISNFFSLIGLFFLLILLTIRQPFKAQVINVLTIIAFLFVMINILFNDIYKKGKEEEEEKKKKTEKQEKGHNEEK